jgi:hypothetical protein
MGHQIWISTRRRRQDRGLTHRAIPTEVPGVPRTGCAFDVAVNTTSDGSLLCPWRYECDYDKNRIPQYMWKARCFDSGDYTSRPVSYRVPTLKLDNICNPFQTNSIQCLEAAQTIPRLYRRTNRDVRSPPLVSYTTLYHFHIIIFWVHKVSEFLWWWHFKSV